MGDLRLPRLISDGMILQQKSRSKCGALTDREEK